MDGVGAEVLMSELTLDVGPEFEGFKGLELTRRLGGREDNGEGGMFPIATGSSKGCLIRLAI